MPWLSTRRVRLLVCEGRLHAEVVYNGRRWYTMVESGTVFEDRYQVEGGGSVEREVMGEVGVASRKVGTFRPSP